MARRPTPPTIQLHPITVKGHSLSPTFSIDGMFSVELEDGEIIKALTFEQLKKLAGSKLEAIAKTPCLSTPCIIYQSYGSCPLTPAHYNGVHKRHGQHMFTLSNKTKQQLSNYRMEDEVLKADMSVEEFNALRRAAQEAEAAFNKFLVANRFVIPKE